MPDNNLTIDNNHPNEKLDLDIDTCTSIEQNSSNYCNEALSIRNIVCKIFKYLDFKSFINCNLINKSMLYDSSTTCKLSIKYK